MAPRISARLHEDYPAAELVAVRCRATSCEIEYDLPAEHAKEIWVFLQLTMLHAPRAAPHLGEDDGTGRVRATFEAELEDLADGEAFAAWYAEHLPIVDRSRDSLREAKRNGQEWWR